MTSEEKTMRCGLIMPISTIDGCDEDHWEEVRTIIKEALCETPFQVELVSDSNEAGIIQKRIVQNIHDNDIVICDVSAKNPNVMFELGMRLAFDKPAIVIKDDKTNYSFDTAPIEHLEYPRDLHYHSIQAFKRKLREKVTATYEASKNPNYTTFLKHFGQFVVAQIDEKKVGKDEYILAVLNELKQEMSLLARHPALRDGAEERIASKTPARFAWRLDPKHVVTEADFVNLVKKHTPPLPPKTELLAPDSLAFASLFKEYVRNCVPSNVAVTPRSAEEIAANLKKAVEENLP